jgi:invasion protein IalB
MQGATRWIVLALVALAIVVGGAVWLFQMRNAGTAATTAAVTTPSTEAAEPSTDPSITISEAPGEAPVVVAQETTTPEEENATGLVKAQYGDWQITCDTPPGASFESCAMIENVIAEDQPNVGLSVIVLKTADGKARLLRVLAPLGVLLPNGLGLNVDGTDMGRVAFVRCLPNGCVAEVVMDDALLKVLSGGENAIFVVFKTPEEGIGIPVSLNGFDEGFAQLP